MTKNSIKHENIMRYILYAIIITIIMYMIITQNSLPVERINVADNVDLFPAEWMLVHDDGTKESITVPGNYDIPTMTPMTIETTIPAIEKDRTYLLIRASMQSIYFYVDGIERNHYDTKTTRPFGDISVSNYVFCDLDKADSGKKLSIVITGSESYSGYINPIYYGESANLWFYIFRNHGSGVLFAVLIFTLSLLIIFLSIFFGIILRTNIDLQYLGFAILFVSFWLLTESKLRQLMVPNFSSFSQLAYVMVILMPLPIVMYVDSIQKYRYKKLYKTLEILILFQLFLICFLEFSHISEMIDTLIYSHLIIGICIISIITTFIIDIKNKQIKEYIHVAFGLLVFMIAAIIEMIMMNSGIYMKLGIFLGFGIVVLLTAAILRTARNIIEHEEARRVASAEEAKNRAEQMSFQMVRTLSTAIDAKDQYTNGHSRRVSEFSVLIARELDWSQTEIENLRYAALLHDIGKIGIPDTILNKPSRLTDTEYDVIKSHTTIGGDILKNVTIIREAENAARHHHERYDGTGYPDRLAGDDIPVYARIIALADSYDAMSSRRVYRKSLAPEKIRSELEKGCGTQFDPYFLEIFLRLLDAGIVQSAEDADYRNENAPEIEEAIHDADVLLKNFMATLNLNYTTEDSIDKLTGLMMRSKGEIKISEAMRDEAGCFAFMDLDNLKTVNDEYGHLTGDKLLTIVGNLFTDCPDSIIPCRLGGDEFIFYMKGFSKAAAREYLNDLLDRFKAQIKDDICFSRTNLSIGLCLCTPSDSYQDICSKADKALYYVKKNGKIRYFFYDSDEDEAGQYRNVDLHDLVNRLKMSGEYDGAMHVEYREFAKLYEYIGNIKERYAHNFKLAMITLNLPQDKTFYIDDLEHVMQLMDIAIKETIRNVDVCTRYSNVQYLVILFGTDSDNVDSIIERIFAKFYKSYVKNDIKPTYEVADY